MINRSWTLRLLASSALLAPLAAHAQVSPTQSPAQNESQTSTGTTEQSATLEPDIIVTAQKRSESVQKVPLAVTVVGGAQLARQNIQQVSDLSKAVPALEVPNIPGQNGGPAIRGIGTSAVSVTSENAVSVVLDGVVLGRTPITSLFDVARIEVLRGPQGMLFGKNASAGVLNITTNAPDPSKFEMIAHLDAAPRFGYGILQGTVNIPTSSNSALRISGHLNTQDGVIKNLGDNTSSLDRDYGGRGRFLWEPTDRLSINLIADYARTDSRDEFIQPDYVGPTAVGLAGVLAACGITASRDNNKVCTNAPIHSTADNFGGSAQIDYKVGDYTVTSVTARRGQIGHSTFDVDTTPIDYLRNSTDGHTEQFSQELRLTSPAGQRLQFVAGVYYSDTDISQTNRGIGTVPLISFGPVVVVPPINNQGIGTADLRSGALFGQGTFNVTDHIRVIAGGRETYDKITTSNLDFGTNLTSTDGTHKYNFSYRVGAQADLTRDVMLYGTYSRGYKGPQVNLPTTAVPGGIVSPEIPKAFELGIKGSVLGNRLYIDINGFYTTVDNFQSQVLINTAIGPQFIIGNVPNVKTRGVELDLFGKPFRGLTINGGLIYDKATYGSGYVAQNISLANVPVGGDQLAGTPRFKANLSGEYAFPVIMRVQPFVQADVVYKSKINFDAAPDAATTLNHQTVVGSRIGIRDPQGRWGLSVWGRNLFDQRYPANIQVGPLENFIAFPSGGVPSTAHVLTIDSYRVIGLTMDARF